MSSNLNNHRFDNHSSAASTLKNFSTAIKYSSSFTQAYLIVLFLFLIPHGIYSFFFILSLEFIFGNWIIYLNFSKRIRLSFGPFSLRIRIRCVWGLLGPDLYGRWKNRLNSKITKIIPVLQKMWFISYEANLFSIEFWL